MYVAPVFLPPSFRPPKPQTGGIAATHIVIVHGGDHRASRNRSAGIRGRRRREGSFLPALQKAQQFQLETGADVGTLLQGHAGVITAPQSCRKSKAIST